MKTVTYASVANNQKSMNAIEKAIAAGAQTLAQVAKAIPTTMVPVEEKVKGGVEIYQVHAATYLNDKFGLERAVKAGFRARDIKRAAHPDMLDEERPDTLKMYSNVSATAIFSDGDNVTVVPLYRKTTDKKGNEVYEAVKVWKLGTVNETSWSAARVIAMLNQKITWDKQKERAEEEMKAYEETETFYYLAEQHYEINEEGDKKLKKTFKELKSTEPMLG